MLPAVVDPVKDVLQTGLRVLPFPARTGLYRIGIEPDQHGFRLRLCGHFLARTHYAAAHDGDPAGRLWGLSDLPRLKALKVSLKQV